MVAPSSPINRSNLHVPRTPPMSRLSLSPRSPSRSRLRSPRSPVFDDFASSPGYSYRTTSASSTKDKLTNLQYEFPDHSNSELRQALREAEGHAGKTRKILRELEYGGHGTHCTAPPSVRGRRSGRSEALTRVRYQRTMASAVVATSRRPGAGRCPRGAAPLSPTTTGEPPRRATCRLGSASRACGTLGRRQTATTSALSCRLKLGGCTCRQ